MFFYIGILQLSSLFECEYFNHKQYPDYVNANNTPPQFKRNKKPFVTESNCELYEEENFFLEFRSYNEIFCYLSQLNEQYSSLTSLKSIGKTFENRDIFAFNITNNELNNQKEIFYFNGGLHGNEWMSPMSVIYIIKQMLIHRKSYVDLTSNFVVMFTPLSNPDGYEYSRNSARSYRKNMHKIGDGFGVDLNRNFDSHFDDIGPTDSPRDENFQGVNAGSELETQALTNYLDNFKGRILGSIDYHSYGQMILRNYGYTKKESMNEEGLITLSEYVQRSIQDLNNQTYSIGRSSGSYPSGGSMIDWLTDTLNSTSLAIEICPKLMINGEYLGKENIIYCAQGAFTSVRAFIHYLNITGPHPKNGVRDN